MNVYFLWHGRPAKGGFLLAARVKEPEKAQVVTIPTAEPVTSKDLYIKVLREMVCDISFPPFKMVLHVEKQSSDNLRMNPGALRVHGVVH